MFKKTKPEKTGSKAFGMLWEGKKPGGTQKHLISYSEFAPPPTDLLLITVSRSRFVLLSNQKYG